MLAAMSSDQRTVQTKHKAMAQSRETSRRAFLKGIVAVGVASPLLGVNQLNARAKSLDSFNLAALADMQADSTMALQRAMDLASQNRLTFHIPAGTYLVSKTLNVPSNVKIVGHDATLVTNIADYGSSGRPAPTLSILNVSNITILGLRIDGRKDNYGHTEYKHCVSISGANNVRIEDCFFSNAKGDGMILNDLNIGRHNTNITVRRSTFTSNYRLGLGLTDGENILIEDCVFTKTSGTSPMSGVDIEPDRGDCRITNVIFRHCDMSGNGIAHQDGGGINVSLRPNPTAPQGNITFDRCTIRQNGIQGVIVDYGGRGVTFKNCDISGNRASGIEIRKDTSNFTVQGGTISNNAVHGIWAIKSTDQMLSNLQIRGVAIRDNSQTWRNNYDGIHLQGDCRDVSISDCTITGSHRYGIWLGDLIEDVGLSANNLVGNALGPLFPIL
jgi:polygalacturonase